MNTVCSLHSRHVAYLTPLYFDEQSRLGGGERYPLNTARALLEADARYSVELVSFGRFSVTRELAPRVPLRILHATRQPRNVLDALSWEVPEAVRDADIVHIHQPFTRSSEVSLLVAKIQGKPTCMTDHGGATSRLGASLASLDLADRIVCQSEFAASLMQTSTRIELVKGGVDDVFFRPRTVEAERDRVLFVGRLLPHKGIDRLLAALPADLPLTICGRPYDPGYYALLRRLAATKNVEFILDSSDEQLRNLYRRAWALVLPSVYVDFYGRGYTAPELMGLTMLEAMACGTPAICSRTAALPEFVRDGETGFVFNSLGELSERLRQLAEDRTLVERLGREARRTIERDWGLRAVGARLGAVYDELLELRKGRP